jgi:hypothetical protein
MSSGAESAIKAAAEPAAEQGARRLTLWNRPAVVAVLVIFVAAGIAAFAAALREGADAAPHAWQAFLVNLLFWLGVAQGGVVVSAAFYLTQGRWGGSAAYRLAEAFIWFVPLGFVLFWLLYFGRDTLFPWVRHPVASKAAWLNVPFLLARDGGGLALMTGLSIWLVRASRRADVVRWAESPDNIARPPAVIRRLSPTIALAYAGVYSLIGFDLVMSLAPVWRSTLFGAYFFEGAFWSALCAIAFIAALVGRSLPAGNRFAESEVLHDFGKMVFAFSVFWVYLFFSQYLPIWYGDIPVETFFIVQRVNYLPWAPLSWLAFVLIWALPFVVLMGKRPKQTPAILGTVSLLGLVGIYLERYVLIVPSLSQHVIPFGWIEALVTLGFIGAFGLCSLSGLERAFEAASAPHKREER